MRTALILTFLTTLSPALAAGQVASDTPDEGVAEPAPEAEGEPAASTQNAPTEQAPTAEAPPEDAPPEDAPHEDPERGSDADPAETPASEEVSAPAEPAERRFPEPSPSDAIEPPGPSYVQGMGRGFFYGVHVHSPSHLTTVQRVGPTFEPLSVGPGAGLIARLGWEFSEGFQLELFGGLSVNGVDTLGKPIRNTFQRADLGLRTRYTIWTGTVVNPFVQVGASLRVYWFEWTGSESPVEAGLVPVVHGALGISFDLTPYFAIDVGASAAYGFGGDIFNEGILFLSPFAGVTLFLYDATGVI